MEEPKVKNVPFAERNAQSGTEAPKREPTVKELQAMNDYLAKSNEQLVNRVKQMAAVIENKSFDYMSFFVSMLFKVLEHPEQYKKEFVVWAASKIEDALLSFDEQINPKPEKTEEETKEEK